MENLLKTNTFNFCRCIQAHCITRQKNKFKKILPQGKKNIRKIQVNPCGHHRSSRDEKHKSTTELPRETTSRHHDATLRKPTRHQEQSTSNDNRSGATTAIDRHQIDLSM